MKFYLLIFALLISCGVSAQKDSAGDMIYTKQDTMRIDLLRRLYQNVALMRLLKPDTIRTKIVYDDGTNWLKIIEGWRVSDTLFLNLEKNRVIDKRKVIIYKDVE